MQEGKQNIWNAPNILTMLRLLLIPIYWVLMMVRDNETAALIVFVTASITDLLDGYIARHFNQVTDWGKLFDPLADKLMVVSVMMTLVLKGAVPLIILIIIGIKEIIMVAGAACMLRRKIVVYSKPVGKTAQFTMVAGMILAFFRHNFSAPFHVYVLWLATVLTLSAMVYYSLACIRALGGHDQGAGIQEDKKEQ